MACGRAGADRRASTQRVGRPQPAPHLSFDHAAGGRWSLVRVSVLFPMSSVPSDADDRGLRPSRVSGRSLQPVSVVEIEYDPESSSFTVDGKTVIPIVRDDVLGAAREVVSSVGLGSLEHALAAYEEQDAATVTAVFVADVPIAQFDPDMSPRAVELGFLGGKLTAQVSRSLHSDGGPGLDVPALFAPLLERHAAEHAGHFRGDQEGHLIEVHSLALVGDDRTVGELFSLAAEAQGVA